MKVVNPLKIHRRNAIGIIENLHLKKDVETLDEFSGINKIIKEKFKDHQFSFKPFTEIY